MRLGIHLIIMSGLLVAALTGAGNGRMRAAQPADTQSCFLLAELGVGEVRRDPSAACRTRVTPASTFKVPHAVAALDAGVVTGPNERMAYGSAGQVAESARRDHTLAHRPAPLRGVVLPAPRRTAPPWPPDVIVSAKTGSATDRSGQGVRWLVGHVARGRRSFVFVSCVVGPPDLDNNAAIDLAARALREAHVL